MSSFNAAFKNAVAKQDCFREFGNLEDSSPSTRTVLCTIAILVLTIALECAAHAFKNEDCCYEKDADGNFIRKDPEPSIYAPSNGTSTDAENPTPENANTQTSIPGPVTGSGGEVPVGERKKKADHTHIASPTCRANRLVTTTALLIPITIAFALRIRETQFEYPWKCQSSFNIPPPKWWAITLFNIIPSVCASMAWLRTLVDCVLVRRNKTVPFEFWPPVLPLAIIAIAITCIGMFARDMVFLVMGRKDLMTFTQQLNEIELQRRENEGEEERGLMHGAGEEEDELLGGDDEVTVYSPRSSMERKSVLSSISTGW
jgi:hypothetical protein